jgi:hypothetical protein
MRLLQQDEHGTLSFTDILYEPPPYAILSHTWGRAEDEVLYDDIGNGTWKEKEAHDKINFIANRAREEHLQYFWVDTCCIDKRNDAELAAAIRSMYRWYKNSAVCYVYLSDVSIGKRDRDGTAVWLQNLQRCRWFRRGWTLQELIAPARVEFYARNHQYIGSRTELSREIHQITKVNVDALNGRPIEEFSLVVRRQWAHGRETTVPEDSAYAMMGLCGVVIIPCYGEDKDQAWKRLDREVRKQWGENALDRRTTDEEARRDTMMEQLRFGGLDANSSTIKPALRGTCEWIIKHPAYLAWRNKATQLRNSFLWVRGKPGVGKSVLMRYLHRSISRESRLQDICISFHFNARGERLEKTLIGMYRALLVQLLSEQPDLQVVLDKTRYLNLENETTMRELHRLFRAAVTMLKDKQLFCFIDALDECREPGPVVQQMIYDFQDVANEAVEDGVAINVCFASRHYPTIDIPTELQIILEQIRDHAHGLQQYVQSQRFSVGLGALATIPAPVQQIIVEKANGVFLWAVLVVEMLKREYTRGFVPAAEQRLNEVPRDLFDLFKEISQRDRHNIQEFSLCLKCILYSGRPLKLREFYFAMMAGLGKHSLRRHAALSEDYMHSYLLSSSKGLAEVTRASTVQFIHESVRNFLTFGHGFEHIDRQEFSVGHVHELLKQCCHRMLETALFEPSDRHLDVAEDSLSDVSESYPFLLYAVQHIFYHADRAHELQVSQEQFLFNFDILNWFKKAALVSIYQEMPERHPSILCVCAWQDCAALVTFLTEKSGYSHRSESNPYDNPLIVAFSSRSRRALRVLLQRESAVDTEGIINELGYRPLSESYSTEFLSRPIYPPLSNERQLWHHRAIIMDYPAFSLHCLRVYAGQLDARSVKSFHEAAARGYKDTVALFLDKGMEIDAAGGYWGTALQAASHRGAIATVTLLLEQGADVNTSGGHWGNALQAASFSGQEGVVALLLERGADVNALGGKQYRTALQAATGAGQKGIVTLLLKNGANPDVPDEEWIDALSAAVYASHLKNAEVLQAPEVPRVSTAGSSEGLRQDVAALASIASGGLTHASTEQESSGVNDDQAKISRKDTMCDFEA